MPRPSLRSVASSPPIVAAPPEKTLAPAVLKASRVLDALAEAGVPLSLAELSRVVELPKSSLHTICATLLHLQLIQRAENGQMSLGPHLMNWANAFLERSDVTREFFAAWEEINELPEGTVTLSVLDGASVVYIACRNGSRPLGVTFRIGMRLPAPYTATGKAMLSTLADADIRAALQGAWPKPLSPNGCRNLKAFLAEMPAVRARGYSIDDGEVSEGMRCFGAPVFGAGGRHAVAGVAVSLLTAEISREKQESAGRAIRRLADRLSQRLGGIPPALG
ncbi:MAG: IclR family transcriptional regulator [Burkholderiaceae bacterium]